jgi:hypothetical protein
VDFTQSANELLRLRRGLENGALTNAGSGRRGFCFASTMAANMPTLAVSSFLKQPSTRPPGR